MKPRASLASVLLAAGLLAPAHRSALAGCLVEAPPVGAPFVDCSGGQVFNIVPPGENGTYNMADFLRAQAGQGFPPHTRDQEPLYAGLLDVAPNLKDADIGAFYKDASFLVDLSQAERVERSRSIPARSSSATSSSASRTSTASREPTPSSARASPRPRTASS